MAIIKTKLVNGQRRIITKVVNGQRRVSCSCCETGCCMYPAYLYDPTSDSGLIKHEDLPDVIIGGGKTYNKITPVDLFDDGFLYGIYLDPTSPNEETEGYIRWRADGGDFGPAWDAFAEGGRNCLVEDLFDNGFWLDDFAETYSYTILQDSGVLTRESLCAWRGGGRSLTFVSNDTFVGWAFNGVRKSGAQNSPVGTYGEAEISE
jgi:hypothetical protein